MSPSASMTICGDIWAPGQKGLVVGVNLALLTRNVGRMTAPLYPWAALKSYSWA